MTPRRERKLDHTRAALPIVAGRPPPHDLEAEAAVLSACMLDPGALGLASFLAPEHFYADANGRIWAAIKAVAARNITVDIITVKAELHATGLLQAIGGPPYLVQLCDATPSVRNVEHHARIVWERWRLRALIAHSQIVAAEGYGDVGDIQAFIDASAHAVHALSRRPDTNQTVILHQALGPAMEAIAAAAARGERITGVSTGYDKLDGKMSGLHDGDLTIVAARPGMGKSALVANIAVNVAAPRDVVLESGERELRQGFGAAIFSLEMPRDQIAIRIACSEARVDLAKLRQGYMSPDDWIRLTEAARFLATLPVWIDDTAGLTLLDLRSKLRRIQSEYETTPERRLRLVVVDYLQLMRGSGDARNREQEVAEISRGLKAIAKDFRLPVIALSQLNRSVETRGKDKRPQMSDLRESGAIEQDADNILFIYRDEYYDTDSEMKGIAELLLAKQRNGPTGMAMLRFTASCTRFDNLAPSDYPDIAED